MITHTWNFSGKFTSLLNHNYCLNICIIHKLKFWKRSQCDLIKSSDKKRCFFLTIRFNSTDTQLHRNHFNQLFGEHSSETGSVSFEKSALLTAGCSIIKSSLCFNVITAQKLISFEQNGMIIWITFSYINQIFKSDPLALHSYVSFSFLCSLEIALFITNFLIPESSSKALLQTTICNSQVRAACFFHTVKVRSSVTKCLPC